LRGRRLRLGSENGPYVASRRLMLPSVRAVRHPFAMPSNTQRRCTARTPGGPSPGYGILRAIRDIFINIFMATTVHIPDPLLKSVDRRAKALGISRNRLVVRALEQAVSVRADWAPEFLQRLRHVDRETSVAADELLDAVTQARRSKKPRDL
jgi:predicted transcriptional regulator